MSSQKHYFSGPSTQWSNNYYLHTQETYRHDPNLNQRQNLTPRNEQFDSNDQTSKSPLKTKDQYPRKSQPQSILAIAQKNSKNQSQQQQEIIEVLKERIENLEQQNNIIWEQQLDQIKTINEQEIQDVKASQGNQIIMCDYCKSKVQFVKQQDIEISRLKGLLNDNNELIKTMNDKLIIHFDKDHISLQNELKVLNKRIQSIVNEKQYELKQSSPNLNQVDQNNIESGKLKKIIIQELQDDYKQSYFQTPVQGKDNQKFKEEPSQLTNQLKNNQEEKVMEETENELDQVQQSPSTKTKIDNIYKSVYNSDSNRQQEQ